jgi:hypothetical protein
MRTFLFMPSIGHWLFGALLLARSDRRSQDEPPPRIARYEIKEEIRTGCYRARDTKLGRMAEITIVTEADAHAKASFLQDAKTLSFVSHPSVAAVFDYNEDENGLAYVVKEYFPGPTLEKAIAQRKVAGIEDALTITSQISDLLDPLHRLGIIPHLDLGNIKVSNTGDHVKLMCLGNGPNQAWANHVTGVQANLHTLGVIFYRILFSSPDACPDPTRLGQMPPKIAEVVKECMSGHYSNVDEVSAALASARPTAEAWIRSRRSECCRLRQRMGAAILASGAAAGIWLGASALDRHPSKPAAENEGGSAFRHPSRGVPGGATASFVPTLATPDILELSKGIATSLAGAVSFSSPYPYQHATRARSRTVASPVPTKKFQAPSRAVRPTAVTAPLPQPVDLTATSTAVPKLLDIELNPLQSPTQSKIVQKPPRNKFQRMLAVIGRAIAK